MPRIFAGTGPRQLRAGESRQDPARSRPDPRAAACGEHGEDGEDGACAWVLLRGQRPLFAGRQSRSAWGVCAKDPFCQSVQGEGAAAPKGRPRRVPGDLVPALSASSGPVLGPDDQANRFGTKGRRRRPAGENDGAGSLALPVPSRRVCAAFPAPSPQEGRGGSVSLVPVYT
jgi:hypothetical protein